MKITLPMPPNRANARWHWRSEKKKKDNYFLECRALYPPSKDEPLSRVTMTAGLYLWSEMDTDNLFARLKWPLDFLVRSGFITDDSPKVIDWTGIPSQHIDRKNQRIELELTPGWFIKVEDPPGWEDRYDREGIDS